MRLAGSARYDCPGLPGWTTLTRWAHEMTQPLREATTVVIVGGGVAGLTAAMLLRRSGISCVVLERHSRAHVEQRQRAGILEYRGVRMFQQWGLAELLGQFPADNTLQVTLDGQPILTGRDAHSAEYAGIVVPQQALVRNLIAAFLDGGGDLRFEVPGVVLHGLDTSRPTVTYAGADGTTREIECDFVAGCDGDHGVSRSSIPEGVLTAYTRDYGITHLTILADAPPPEYAAFAVGEHGYAAHFARGPKASRFYLEIDPGDTLADWPAERIWAELRKRFWRPGLPGGPITETETFTVRSQVFEPMSYGRLYLLGDAAHVISPMGAKGMNLALYDAEVFTVAVRDHVQDGDDAGLRAYSDTCLARTWRYQEYADWMSGMLLALCGPRAAADPYAARIARARLARGADPASTAALAWGELITGLG
jgi:p-hydroxybenzoate 3-monooxygenase